MQQGERGGSRANVMAAGRRIWTHACSSCEIGSDRCLPRHDHQLDLDEERRDRRGIQHTDCSGSTGDLELCPELFQGRVQRPQLLSTFRSSSGELTSSGSEGMYPSVEILDSEVILDVLQNGLEEGLMEEFPDREALLEPQLHALDLLFQLRSFLGLLHLAEGPEHRDNLHDIGAGEQDKATWAGKREMMMIGD